MINFLCRGCCILICCLLVACGTDINAANNLGPETLVWSDEFNSNSAQSAPDSKNWTYDTGASGWGNQELENYCAYGSNTTPCDAKNPNAYVGNDGYLHIVARNPANRVYTSARLKTQGLQSFQYGRMEARIKIPEGQGFWPAFWMLGDDMSSAGWPACGEIDIMENVGKTPYSISGSIHGPGLNKTVPFVLSDKFGSGFHTFGIVWSPSKMMFYVDSLNNVYATYTSANLPSGAVWPFNEEKFFFVLNVAVGGNWPGPPDATTTFPQEMLVDYVRVYSINPSPNTQ